jgi:hypothetical protein
MERESKTRSEKEIENKREGLRGGTPLEIKEKREKIMGMFSSLGLYEVHLKGPGDSTIHVGQKEPRSLSWHIYDGFALRDCPSLRRYLDRNTWRPRSI